MGPEHSSARLERFLSLAARDNMQIVYPSTPAQYFHCLRRQVLRRWRKPLVVLTPKSLLRHPRAVSSLDDLAKGTFQRVLPDERAAPVKETSRILLCSGKIYYDLVDYREREKHDDVAIVRVEQFYPLLGRVVAKGPGTLSRRHACLLGAGGTAQHGRQGLLDDAVWRQSVRAISAHLCQPARIGQPGHGIEGRAQTRTTVAPGTRVRRVITSLVACDRSDTIGGVS